MKPISALPHAPQNPPLLLLLLLLALPAAMVATRAARRGRQDVSAKPQDLGGLLPGEVVARGEAADPGGSGQLLVWVRSRCEAVASEGCGEGAGRVSMVGRKSGPSHHGPCNGISRDWFLGIATTALIW